MKNRLILLQNFVKGVIKMGKYGDNFVLRLFRDARDIAESVRLATRDDLYLAITEATQRSKTRLEALERVKVIIKDHEDDFAENFIIRYWNEGIGMNENKLLVDNF